MAKPQLIFVTRNVFGTLSGGSRLVVTDNAPSFDITGGEELHFVIKNNELNQTKLDRRQAKKLADEIYKWLGEPPKDSNDFSFEGSLT